MRRNAGRFKKGDSTDMKGKIRQVIPKKKREGAKQTSKKRSQSRNKLQQGNVVK